MTETEDTSVKLNFPFVGIPSFMRSQICTDLDQLDADIAVFGIPHDEAPLFLLVLGWDHGRYANIP